MRQKWISWWHRPSGGREVLWVIIPLVISTCSWTVMHFIDRMFLIWHSQQELAAALPAAMVSFVVVCFFLGVATYVNTFVAQYFGAKRDDRIGLAVWQGVWIGLISIPLLLATIPLAPWFFEQIGHGASVQPLEAIYYQGLCYGQGGMVVGAALAGFFIGRGDMRTIMLVNLFAAGLNIVLDYPLIFGAWGFEERGIQGAAWATSIAQWGKVIVLFLLMMRLPYRQRFGTVSGIRLDPTLMRRLLRFGAPSGVQFLVECSGITALIMVLGRLGELELTASNLAFNVEALAFMPMLGVGIAVSTLVGQRLGEERPDLAERATWTAFQIGIAYVLCVASFYVFAPRLLLLAHAAHADPGQFERIAELTVVLLRFVAVFCLFDATNIVFVNAIKGAGDTRFVMITTASLASAAVLATWFGTEYLAMGIYGTWTIITVWIFLLGVIFFARFRQGKWRSMRVIEPTLIINDENFSDEDSLSPKRRSPVLDPLPVPATENV